MPLYPDFFANGPYGAYNLPQGTAPQFTGTPGVSYSDPKTGAELGGAEPNAIVRVDLAWPQDLSLFVMPPLSAPSAPFSAWTAADREGVVRSTVGLTIYNPDPSSPFNGRDFGRVSNWNWDTFFPDITSSEIYNFANGTAEWLVKVAYFRTFDIEPILLSVNGGAFVEVENDVNQSLGFVWGINTLEAKSTDHLSGGECYSYKRLIISLPVAGFTYEIDEDASTETAIKVDFDSAQSYGRGAEITQYFWRFFNGSTNTDVVAENPSFTFPGPGNYFVTLIVTDREGRSVQVYVPISIEFGSDQYGAIITPTGTLYVPTKRDGSGTRIVRFNQGAAPETVIELPTEKGVHLMRHGAAFYKGNAANELSSSADEGGSWTVESTAFTSDYKCIDWVATAPDGGFIAIATKDKLLYSATSFDGTNWGAPVYQFGDGTRGVSRSQIEQSSASDESHILISDGTFAVRSDDYCATPGEVLFQ